MKIFILLIFMMSCQSNEQEKLDVNISSLDKFMITLGGEDFQSFKKECLSGKAEFSTMMEAKLEERLKSLNSGFIKSLFILQECSSEDLQKKTREALGVTVLLFSPQIFFENLLQYRKKIRNWEEVVLFGDTETLQKKLNLVKDAPTDTPSMKSFKAEIKKLLQSKIQ